jgi:hypothetical protein
MINGAQNPNFAYTIGLHKKFGFELVIAGQYISVKDYEYTFDLVVKKLETIQNLDLIHINKVFNKSEVKLIEMHTSWKKRMILGAYDYYNIDEIKAFQITPNNRLLDIPIMSEVWNIDCPIWGWLDKDWNYPIPKTAHVVTNVQFLRGETITEIIRWNDDYWEMFVGPAPEVLDDDVRILPFGTMIGIDDSLMVASNLKKNDGLWRNNKEDKWNKWY